MKTTTVDEKIRKAKEHISEAYKIFVELLILFDEDTGKHNEFREGYIGEVEEAAMELLKLKQKLS